MTKVEALKLLDFDVEKKEIFTKDPETKIPDRFAMVRKDTNQIVGVISNRYKVIPHKDVFTKPLTEFAKLYNIEGTHLINNGGKVVIQLLSKQTTRILDKDYKLLIHMINSYDGSTSFRLQIGLYGVASKTIHGMMGQSFVETRRIHLGVSDVVVKELVSETYQTIDRCIPMYTSKLTEYSSKPLMNAYAVPFLEQMGFGKNSIKNIMKELHGETLADMYHALTAFYSSKLTHAKSHGQVLVDINTLTGNVFDSMDKAYSKVNKPVHAI
jgi:hypothetical protein